jgi:hypothetical protein
MELSSFANLACITALHVSMLHLARPVMPLFIEPSILQQYLTLAHVLFTIFRLIKSVFHAYITVILATH